MKFTGTTTLVVSEEEFSHVVQKFVEWHHYKTNAEVLPKRFRVHYGNGCTKLLFRFGKRTGEAINRWPMTYGNNGKRIVFRTVAEFEKGFLRFTHEDLLKHLTVHPV